MIKQYCDRCGKESDRLFPADIPTEELSFGDYKTKSVDLCFECRKEAEAKNRLITKIRILVFSDFLRKEGEG